MAKEDNVKISEKAQKAGKPNPWMLATIALAVILLIVSVKAALIGGIVGTVSKSEAGIKVTSLINGYFVQDGSAVLNSVTEESGLYKVTLEYNTNQIPVYLTKDGKSLILPNGIVSVSEIEASAKNTNGNAQAPANLPKTDKPTVELFVMSFCPYGVKAENNILPVIALLKDKIDFKVKFIASVNGNTIDQVQSLHGLNEAKEDARQLVIMKYYHEQFYDYLKKFNENCYSVSSDAAKLDECWKKAAAELGMDTKKIETAAYGEEGIALLKQNEADANKYGVSGSPTFVINGVKSDAIYSGTAATQQAICSAFNAVPSECGQAVTVTGAVADTPSGSCS